jgi:glucose dehydrogenase
LIQNTKKGLIFALNRETGEPIWPIEERPVVQTEVPGNYTAATATTQSAAARARTRFQAATAMTTSTAAAASTSSTAAPATTACSAAASSTSLPRAPARTWCTAAPAAT